MTGLVHLVEQESSSSCRQLAADPPSYDHDGVTDAELAELHAQQGPPDGNQSAATPAVERLQQFRARVLSRDMLDTLPQPAPLIADTLDRNTVAVLVGARSTAKTFLALGWASSVATGRPWMGRGVLAAGRVLYIAAEGASGLALRLAAWEHSWGGGQRVERLEVYPRPVQLLSASESADLVEHVRAEGYALVVLDTLARCLVGGDENSARDVGIAIDAASQVREAAGSTVLLVHHTGKDGETTRGSSALESGVDTVYRARGDAQHVEIDRTKRKEGPQEDRLSLRLQPVLDSCVLQSGVHEGADMAGKTEELLALFMDTFVDTGASKAELREAARERGITSSGTFSRALNALLRTGALQNKGTDARPYYRAGGTT